MLEPIQVNAEQLEDAVDRLLRMRGLDVGLLALGGPHIAADLRKDALKEITRFMQVHTVVNQMIMGVVDGS